MLHSVEFCEARAREAADEAGSTELGNVRERALRSEAAWRAMADRLRVVRRNRKAITDERESNQSTE